MENTKKSAKTKPALKTLFQLFSVFFRIGAFTFGGGLAMLPLIEHETVVKNKWINHEEIVDVFAVAQSLPGVIALNSSIFVGYRVAGLLGAFFAVMGMIIPSFVTILVISIFFSSIQDNVWVQKALAGVRAGVAGIILLAVFRLGKKILKNPFAIILGIVSFILISIVDIHAGWVVLSGGLAGLLYQMTRKEKLVEMKPEDKKNAEVIQKDKKYAGVIQKDKKYAEVIQKDKKNAEVIQKDKKNAEVIQKDKNKAEES